MAGNPEDGTGRPSPDAWTIIGLLLGGLLVWGGIGYLLDRLFGFHALFLPIGLIVGAVGGTWLVLIRFGERAGRAVSGTNDQPERQMAKRALVPGAVLAVAAFGIGYAANGMNAAVSALLGVIVVSLSFAGYVVVLGRARKVSAGAMQAVTLGGWLIRLGIVVGCLFAVRALGGDVAAFGFAAIATALAVAIYEAWVVLTGKLEPAADPAGPPAGDPTGTKPVGSGA